MSPWNQWWNIFHSCGIWLKLPEVLAQHTGEVGTARFDQAQHRSWLSAKLWTSKSIPLASGFLSALHYFPNNWSRIEPSLETLEVGNGAYVRHACWLLLIFQSVKIMVLSSCPYQPLTQEKRTHTNRPNKHCWSTFTMSLLDPFSQTSYFIPSFRPYSLADQVLLFFPTNPVAAGTPSVARNWWPLSYPSFMKFNFTNTFHAFPYKTLMVLFFCSSSFNSLISWLAILSALGITGPQSKSPQTPGDHSWWLRA